MNSHRPQPMDFQRPAPGRAQGVTAMVMLAAVLCFVLLTLLTSAAHAARPAPPSDPLADPMTVQVDATNTAQWIFQVQQTLPVAPGPLRLLYPRWLPGYHGPYGEPGQIGGLAIVARGQPLAWQRPADNLNAFDVMVPAGTDRLDIRF